MAGASCIIDFINCLLDENPKMMWKSVEFVFKFSVIANLPARCFNDFSLKNISKAGSAVFQHSGKSCLIFVCDLNTKFKVLSKHFIVVVFRNYV